MFGSAVLEIAIGLSFVFLILSLCATAIVEGLVESRQWRGRLLHSKLGGLLGDELRDVFYQDRRIADLASGDPVAPGWVKRSLAWLGQKIRDRIKLKRRSAFASTSLRDAIAAARKLNARRLPSQIPDDVFADVMLEWLQGTNLPQQLHPDFADDRTLPYPLAQLLNAMNLRADGSQEALRHELLTWFRQSMERTSGEFKRRIRQVLYIVAAFLVLLTNADSLHLAKRSQNEPALRAQFVALSESVVEKCPEGPKGCPELESLKQEVLKDSAAGTSVLLGWTKEGWDSLSWRSLIGWMITIFAIGLGADFWFGALKRMLSLRSGAAAQPKPEEPGSTKEPDTLAPRAAAALRPLDLAAKQVTPLRGFQPLRYAESDVHAFWLAQFASLAYCDAAQLTNNPLLVAHGLTATAFDRGGTQGFVFTSDQACIVAFRGTETSLDDLLTDADARLQEEPWEGAGEGVRVHKGFHAALARVWDDVLGLVKKSGKPIWLTGHSLGGALAVLAACRLARHSPALMPAGIYTFGQPRAGSEAWTKSIPVALQQRIFRYVNDNDIVPLVPPPRSMDYHHVGHARYFDGSGRLHHTRTLWERIAEQLTPALKAIASGDAAWDSMAREHVRDRVADHGMARYIECLERLDSVRALWST